MKRHIFFIDGSNLYSYLRDTFGSGKVHIPTLCALLVHDDDEFVEWRYYAAPVPQGNTPREITRYYRQQRFLNYVSRHRKGTLCLGRFQKDISGFLREKGVDVMLAIDLVRLAAENGYDVATVLSGDGDLAPAIDMARGFYGKVVYVALPGKVDAYHILQAADGFREITKSIYDKARAALK